MRPAGAAAGRFRPPPARLTDRHPSSAVSLPLCSAAAATAAATAAAAAATGCRLPPNRRAEE